MKALIVFAQGSSMFNWTIGDTLPLSENSRGLLQGRWLWNEGATVGHSGDPAPGLTLIKTRCDNLEADIWRLFLAPDTDALDHKAWLQIGGFSLPQNCQKALANGFNGWSESPILGLEDRLYPESNPDQIPFGDHELIRYSSQPGHFHSWAFSILIHTVGKQVTNSLLGSLRDDLCYSVFWLNLPDAHLEIGIDIQGLDRHQLPRTSDGYLLGGWLIPRAEAKQSISLNRWTQEWTELMRRERPYWHSSRARNLPEHGYTSWYYRYTQIDPGWLLKNLDAIPREGWRYFQVDDGYQHRIGDWLDNAKAFPEGIQPVLRSAQERGLQTGIWCAPFVAVEGSLLYQQQPEWFQRHEDGSLVLCGDFPHWGGRFYALDSENKEVQEYLETVLTTYFRDWGCRFLKADFLYATARTPGGGFTRAQRAYRAQRLLLNLCQKFEAELLACGPVLSSAFGLCDYCRTGPDVLPHWEDPVKGHETSREKCSTRASIVNTINRSLLDGQTFLIDPDVFILRRTPDVTLTEQQQDLLANINEIFGSLVFTSDLLSEYKPSDQARLQKVLNNSLGPSLGRKITNLSMLEGNPQGWHIRLDNDKELKIRLDIYTISVSSP